MSKIPHRKLMLLVALVANIVFLYIIIVVVIKFVTILYPFDKWPTFLNQSIILQYAHQTSTIISDILRDDDVKKASNWYDFGKFLKFIR